MTLSIARDSQGLVAILHSTIIVRDTPTALHLSTGGFRTKTTLSALRKVGQECDFTITSVAGQPQATYQGKTQILWDDCSFQKALV